MSNDLSLVAVGAITQRFLVPSYQRGYRWGEDEVRVLIEDIAAIQEKDDRDYCLQPVVVKKRHDGRYELIDGQQRLTTLYLLYLFMQKEGFKKFPPPFSLEYETRPQSGEFLRDLDPARAEENIDFFHLSGAFKCIQRWFEVRGGDAEFFATDIYLHLRKRVKVIWYEAAPEVDSTELFTRLNVGRIPLTNAELIKALLLGRARENGVASHRQIEIGMQWDVIERDLHDEGLWAFLTNRQPAEYPTRIELLFELMAEKKTPDRFHTFHHFKQMLEEGKTPEEVWNDVLNRMDLVKEWYEDRHLYHSIGYLVATGTGDDDLRALMQASATMAKSQLRARLDAEIIDRLDLTRDQIDDLEYQRDRAKCLRVLLLFNVESTRRIEGSFERYPFHVHKANRWSLEHIHAQNAEELVKKEQWQAWLREHEKVLRALSIPDATRAALRDAIVEEVDAGIDDVTKDSFLELSVRVMEVFGDSDTADELHGIDNLALLPRDTNSALNNAAFAVKRERILRLDRSGGYIPICTRRAFLKYYTESGDQQLHFWSKQDRKAYFDAMFAEETGVLTRYLRKTS
ncbi:DUF262 domain-containing protein [Sorangium sp. So ce367]|uniref:DUF262 domain-containing protein n=1 Tax=Sorangium sp. So ce367 TaxID=3133305 RepID=UPI003F6029BD